MMWRTLSTFFMWSVMVMVVVYGGGGVESLSWEAEVLLSLKKSISVEEGFLDALSSWKDDFSGSNSSFHCRWRGIQCDGFNRVVGLNISGMKLLGTISPEIGKLTNLENLTLSFNNLSSPLPNEITHIGSLRVLNISHNQFAGSFPSNLSKWKELQVLDVYNNNFTGPLPVELSELSKLEHIHLGGNFFSGRIPPEYSRIPNLKYLALMGNKLTGRIPWELGSLSKLEQLYLGYDNEYQGGIPPEIGNLTNLFYLDMKNCGLSGPIPPELGRLRKLETLYLYLNSLSGHIPAELGNLSSLKFLDLSNNNLTGAIPSEFGKLESLNLLYLFNNSLYGIIPPFIAELPNLEVLGLWNNSFAGQIPQNLGLNGRLLQLDLSTNRLTGLLPPYLCKSKKLQTLIMLQNYFFGSIPENFGNCKSLRKVRMAQNYLNGSIPHGFLNLPSVEIIELQDNYLTGGIPTYISVTRKLGRINLSNNRLSGPLPPAIGNLSGLQYLLLNGNQFSGIIPREIGRLKQLSKIDFSNNQLSGTIAPEISQCALLTYLDLSQNDLGENIPLEIAQIPDLNYLNVSGNHLVGNIPRQIGVMQSLTSLDLSNNNLSGVVPDNGQFRFFNVTSYEGNPGLCVSYLTGTPCTQSTESYKAPGTAATQNQLSSTTVKLLLIVGMLFCCTALAIPAIFKARTLWNNNTSPTKRWRLTAFQRLHFSCEDILECLTEDNIIGKGGSGVVYRGLMPSGQQVAVKKLPAIGRGSSHDDHGFSAEIKTLGKIRHRHIVKLLCFCTNKDINLLVYEYMANGSLGEMLHGTKGGHLHWETRYRIALEAALGLCYLHHDCSPLILHRDVKSNNILLDSNFEAHVADFGLAKFLQDSSASQCMSAIAGSYGYIAPEYAYTLKVDEKSDVYSFGVVLLELITGRRAVGEFGEGVDIVQWVKKTTESVKERVLDVIDSRLSTVPLEEVKHVFYIAMLCVQDQSSERPTMREVVHMLNNKFRNNYKLR